MLEIGSIVDGKYKILLKVGHGGMSNVYLAINEAANKRWAIKEIDKEGTQVRQDPKKETSIMKRLRHPNLPQIVDVIETETTYLIVMDYVEGHTLRQVVEDEGPQKQETVVEWALQLCDVLDYLHNLDPPIIYRDMKPENVMLRPDGKVILIDFGIAREYRETKTNDTRPLGTVGYAAPEQYGGAGQTDARTDIYSLGATIYHLVTGKNPTKPPYEIKPIRRWNPALSSGLEAIIIRCTKNDPDARYQNIKELRYALLHYRELEKEYQKKKMSQLKRVFAAAVAGVMLTAAGIGAKAYASSIINSTYESHIRTAQTAITKEEQVQACFDAIRTTPDRSEAYILLIKDIYLSDGTFDRQEAEELSSIMGFKEADGRSTMEEKLRKNQKNYDATSYEIGLAYFYYYAGDGSKQLSRAWFDTARNSSTLDKTKRGRAERFYSIADYYAQLGNRNKAGDNTASYKTYWEDMTALTAGDIAAEDNIQTALIMYKEFTYQAGVHAKEFRDAGIGREEILSELDRIHKNMEWIMEQDGYDPETGGRLADAVFSNIESAKKTIETVYFE